jgi:hypothetical protein
VIDLLKNTVCLMMQVKLTNAPHLSKYFDKNSKDTQQLLISHYICNWVDDVTWLQTKWNISRTKHGNQNLQNKLLYTLRALSFKKIKLLIILLSKVFIIIINLKSVLFKCSTVALLPQESQTFQTGILSWNEYFLSGCLNLCKRNVFIIG